MNVNFTPEQGKACLEIENAELKKENERLKNIIYTTLEYVDREEVSSVGTPFTSTSIGKEIKELLEGEKTFNGIYKENQRLNNVLNELEKWLKVNLIDLEKQNASNIYNEGLKQGMLANGRLIQNKLNELKESDK